MRVAVMPLSGIQHRGVTSVVCSVQLHLSGRCLQADVLQAVLQGPRQSFRLPVADFKQAVLDAQNGVEGPGSSGTGLKVRLPMGKRSSVGHASKQKGQPRGARNKPPGQSRFVIQAAMQARSASVLPFGMFSVQQHLIHLCYVQLALLSKANRQWAVVPCLSCLSTKCC